MYESGMSIHYIKVVHGFPSRQIHGLERERGQRPTDPKCMFKIIKSGHICLQLILILHLTLINGSALTKSLNGSMIVILQHIYWLMKHHNLQEEYRKQLAGNMMNKSSRILAFKSKPPPPPEEGFERNARLLYSENIQSSSAPKRNKIFRHIPQVHT